MRAQLEAQMMAEQQQAEAGAPGAAAPPAFTKVKTARANRRKPPPLDCLDEEAA